MPALGQGAGVVTGADVLVGAPGAPPRPLITRRPLVNGRALLGGLLVAVAAVGTFATYVGAHSDHRLAYVVAARQLRPGERLTAADLTTDRMVLPVRLAGQRVFRDPGRLLGAVVVGPVAAGELIQASDVVAAGVAPYRHELSFAIDPARAVDGTLQPGETVEVLATYGSGSAAVTVEVVAAAHVVAVENASDPLGGHQAENVTLGLDSADDTMAVTNAVNAGQLELVLTTAPDDGGAVYRTPGGTGGG